MPSTLDKAITNLREKTDGGNDAGNGSPARRTPELFEDAAQAVAAEIRRMQDMSKDIDHELDKLRWRGESATYFRKHAHYQRVRAGQNIEMMESLRVLLLRAADVARQTHAKAGAP